MGWSRLDNYISNLAVAEMRRREDQVSAREDARIRTVRAQRKYGRDVRA